MTNPKIISIGNSLASPSEKNEVSEILGIMPIGKLSPQNMRLLLIYGIKNRDISSSPAHQRTLVSGAALLVDSVRGEAAHQTFKTSNQPLTIHGPPSYHLIQHVDQQKPETLARDYQPFASRSEQSLNSGKLTDLQGERPTEARNDSKPEQQRSNLASPSASGVDRSPAEEPQKTLSDNHPLKAENRNSESSQTHFSLRDSPGPLLANDIQRTIATLFNRPPEGDRITATPRESASYQPGEQNLQISLSNRDRESKSERNQSSRDVERLLEGGSSIQPTLDPTLFRNQRVNIQDEKTNIGDGDKQSKITGSPSNVDKIEIQGDQSVLKSSDISQRLHETSRSEASPSAQALGNQQQDTPLKPVLSHSDSGSGLRNDPLRNPLYLEVVSEVQTAGATLVSNLERNINLLRENIERQIALQQQQQFFEERAQRVERLRDIQQISAVERSESQRSSQHPKEQPNSQNIRGETTSITIEKLRESIIDRLTAIQSRIESLHTAHEKLDASGSHLRVSNIQGRESLITIHPLKHSQRSSLTTRMADRSSDNAPSSQLKALIESLSPQRSGLKNDIGGFNRQRGDLIVERNKYSTTTIINSNSAHKTREISNPARNQDLPSHIINILRGFSERSVNFNLLSNLDTSLDRACLTIATGAALGALGLALLYKATNLVAIQTLRALREDLVSTAISNEADTVREEGDLEAKDIAQEEQINLERALDAALEKFTVSQLKTSGDQGIVVDLVGIVVSATDDAPIAGALVKCSEFGICKTGDDGRFMFANIPLGASYTITVKVPGKSLKPQQISGICGELGFIRVRI